MLPQVTPAAEAKGTEFAGALEKSLSQVNQLQTEADQLASKVAAGDIGVDPAGDGRARKGQPRARTNGSGP